MSDPVKPATLKFFEAVKHFADERAVSLWLSSFSLGGNVLGEKRIVPAPVKPSDPSTYDVLCDDLRLSIVRRAQGIAMDSARPRAVIDSFFDAWRAGKTVAVTLSFSTENNGLSRTIGPEEIAFIEDVDVKRSMFTIAGRQWSLVFFARADFLQRCESNERSGINDGNSTGRRGRKPKVDLEEATTRLCALLEAYGEGEDAKIIDEFIGWCDARGCTYARDTVQRKLKLLRNHLSLAQAESISTQRVRRGRND